MPPREWIYLLSQIVLVAGIELTDDSLHAMAPQANAASGLANAMRVVSFEQSHGLWLEPGLQGYFAATHHFFGHTIGWAQVQPIVDAIYGQGHVIFTLAFALWMYCCRRPLFAFVRNVFVITSALAVLLYESFPLAPPRLARGLRWDGHPYHFVDSVFGKGGLKLSFNEYAAMPSLHVAWALIVGLSLAWVARPLVVRVLGLIYPLVMMLTVVVTGNHYVLDALGAVAIVCLAADLSVLIVWRRKGFASLGQTLLWLDAMRRLSMVRRRKSVSRRALRRPVATSAR